jgi:glycosyltransferase involved in cell wall biosynthesis
MTRPIVSVCIPAYRAAAYLEASIESVLTQTLRDWELIVLDNASPDGTGAIARSFGDPRIVVHTNPHTVALQTNWNAAVDLARGRYVKVLPADDLLEPDCLARQVKAMETEPDVTLVACRRNFVDVAGQVVVRDRGLAGLVGLHEGEDVIRRVLRSGINPIGEPAALLFRRDDLVPGATFDASLPFPMDLELSVRLLGRGAFFGIDQALASFRIRPDSVSATGYRSQGAEHRRLLRRIAASAAGDRRISRAELWRGLALTYPAGWKRRLLFRVVNQPWPPLRRLPAVVLDHTRSPL